MTCSVILGARALTAAAIGRWTISRTKQSAQAGARQRLDLGSTLSLFNSQLMNCAVNAKPAIETKSKLRLTAVSAQMGRTQRIMAVNQ
ncbi:MAG: hypothetical protein ACYTEX_28195, partial [Planctomycetota bacterium]